MPTIPIIDPVIPKFKKLRTNKPHHPLHLTKLENISAIIAVFQANYPPILHLTYFNISSYLFDIHRDNPLNFSSF